MRLHRFCHAETDIAVTNFAAHGYAATLASLHGRAILNGPIIKQTIIERGSINSQVIYQHLFALGTYTYTPPL